MTVRGARCHVEKTGNILKDDAQNRARGSSNRMNCDQHILIVDDKRENLLALKHVLRDVDAQVTSAASGNDALAATLHQNFALAILDVQMPEMDGFELAELLRGEDRTRNLPIIFMSAVYSDDFHVFKGYAAGAVDFLTKPFEPAILLNKVRFFLLVDKQRQTLENKLDLEKSKNYLENILTSMAELVMVVSRELKIRTANRAALSLLGYSDDELADTPLQKLFANHVLPDDLPDETDAPLSKTLRLEDVYLLTKSGVQVPVLLNVSCLRNDDHDAVGLVLVAIDNTERKRNEERNRALEEQLLHSQRLESIGRLAGGVAHDFNNLLTVILSCSSLVAEKVSEDESLRTDVFEIIDAAQRGESLVRQLLTFGHKQFLCPAVLNLNEIVNSTVRMLERTLGEDVTLVLQLAPEIRDIYADPVQLVQVIMNLAINARDAMPQGGTLTIATGPTESSSATASVTTDVEGSSGVNRVQLTVQDTGCGIAEDVAPCIFEPFFTTKDEGQGTGLGLSVVRGVVEQSGGQVSLASLPGEGAVFKVEFPVTTRQRVPSERSEVSKSRQAGQGTILVVEDENIIRKLIVRILRKHQYQVFEARTLSEAMRVAREVPHLDLLLTDVVMPEHSGPEVAQSLRKDQPDLDIIFMSGYADNALELQSSMSEQSFFLQKPFMPNTLVETVNEVLSG